MNKWVAVLLLLIPTLTSFLPIPPQQYLPLSSATADKKTEDASPACAQTSEEAGGLLDLAVWADRQISALPDRDEERLIFGVQRGENIFFDPTQVEKRLELDQGSLLGITLTSLPAAASGQLLWNGKPAESWSYLTRSQIQSLTFVPASDTGEADFSFLPHLKGGEGETSLSVFLTFSEEKNASPTAAGDSYNTKINMKVWGWFPVADDDDDDLKVIITRRPSKGTVETNGLSFRYEPYLDASGSDQFSYCVLDGRGALSEEAVITVRMEQSRSPSFADMAGDSQEYAAVMLQERGILSGEQVGGQSFFYPERTVSRGDFLVMLMACAGMDQNLPVCVNTGLTNDGQIPLWLKPYVYSALSLGILEEKPFDAQEIITRAEAVVLVSRVTGRQTGSGRLCYTDADEIPAWAVGSYRSLSGQNILDAVPSQALPNQSADRAYCAGLLWSLIEQK